MALTNVPPFGKEVILTYVVSKSVVRPRYPGSSTLEDDDSCMLCRGLDSHDIVIGNGQLVMWSFRVALYLATAMAVSNGVVVARSC